MESVIEEGFLSHMSPSYVVKPHPYNVKFPSPQELFLNNYDVGKRKPPLGITVSTITK